MYRHIALITAFIAFSGSPLLAQTQEEPVLAAGVPPYAQAQLDQLVAPIALYPDQLLAEIMTASTYPIEIVEEDRWLRDPANARYAQDQSALVNALAQQPWDMNVKALASFPQVLQMLDENVQWTEFLGTAVVAQQADVMDSVQRLRQQAVRNGTLTSTAQQTVTNVGGVVSITPGNLQTVYVPYYNPAATYGTWQSPNYPPYSFAPPPGVYTNGGFLTFDNGFPIYAPLFNVVFLDFPHHEIERHHRHEDSGPRINPGVPQPPAPSNPWRHDPSHHPNFPQQGHPTPIPLTGFMPPSHQGTHDSNNDNHGVRVYHGAPENQGNTPANPAAPSVKIVKPMDAQPAAPHFSPTPAGTPVIHAPQPAQPAGNNPDGGHDRDHRGDAQGGNGPAPMVR